MEAALEQFAVDLLAIATHHSDWVRDAVLLVAEKADVVRASELVVVLDRDVSVVVDAASTLDSGDIAQHVAELAARDDIHSADADDLHRRPAPEPVEKVERVARLLDQQAAAHLGVVLPGGGEGSANLLNQQVSGVEAGRPERTADVLVELHVAADHANLQDPVMFSGGGNDLVAPLEAHLHRLLEQDVLPGLNRRDRVVKVSGVGGAYENGINVVRREQFRIDRPRVFLACLEELRRAALHLGHRFRILGRIRPKDGRDLEEIGELVRTRDMRSAALASLALPFQGDDIAGPNDGQTNFTHRENLPVA